MNHCPRCTQPGLAERIKTEYFTDYLTGEHTLLQAQIPVLECQHCGLEFMDHRAEEIREAVVHAYLNENDTPKADKPAIVIECPNPQCSSTEDDVHAFLEAREYHRITEIEGDEVYLSPADTEYHGSARLRCLACHTEFDMPTNAEVIHG